MRYGTLSMKLAEILLNIGACYTSDLTLYAKMSSGGSLNYGTRLIRKMEQEGLIETSYVLKPDKSEKNEHGASYPVCQLSIEGMNALLDALATPAPARYDYYRRYARRLGRKVNTVQVKKLRTRLNDARMQLMFVSADIPVFPYEKPSLYHLCSKLNRMPMNYQAEFDHKELYRDALSVSECAQMLEKGIFYTLAEIRGFFNEDSPGASDTIMSSRIRGMFISKRTCLLVYIARRGENRIIRISKGAEERFRSLLRPLLRITEVVRAVPELDRKYLNEKTGAYVIQERYMNDVYALIISDGDSMVCSTASGSPHGIIRNKDLHRETGKMQSFSWLTGDSELYDRIFITPCTMNGISALCYLCDNDIESWVSGSKELFASSRDFTASENDPFYPADETGTGDRVPAIFMPVFEAKELARIARTDHTVCILTYRDMFDAVARAARKEVILYDAETMERAGRDAVTLYDSSGRVKGIGVIEDMLRGKGLCCAAGEYRRLPEEYNMTFREFFNAVGRGEIDPNEVISRMKTAELEEKSVRIRHRKVSLTFGEGFTKKLRQAARYRDTSITNYIRGRIYDDISKDSNSYVSAIRENRNWPRSTVQEEGWYPEPLPEDECFWKLEKYGDLSYDNIKRDHHEVDKEQSSQDARR